MGSALEAMGAAISGSAWSARVLDEQPDLVARLHRAYADAGATVHTANTFRATPEATGGRYRELVERAVAVARGAVPAEHRIAGSISPAADCYAPGARPPSFRERHRAMAAALAASRVDLFLCETFIDRDETLAAVEACAAYDKPTWLAMTGGPAGELASPEQLAALARDAVRAGATAILVNCTAATLTSAYLEALRDLEVPRGAYANAGRPEERLGYLADWGGAAPSRDELRARAARYADLARDWVRAGATLIGGCCGTFPEHIEALRKIFGHDP
ncbi:MAG: homocysteine S-methyltransferase family protein [Polyangiaceae bacterium]|nr:homocysteine S-methyltransferase family protein [Polyangiaceae bacterium]